MNKELQQEIKSKLRLIDDDAKPLAGSLGLYTRLALLGYRTHSNTDRYFTLFAQSEKLFNFEHDQLGTQDWIREGFEKKWMYIVEVLHRPSSTDTMDRYLIKVDSNDLWVAIFEYIKMTGILDRFSEILKSRSYGLPKDDLPGVGFNLPRDNK